MASLKVERFRFQRLVSTFVAVAFAFVSLLIVVESAEASALFRLKRTWWFSQAGSWTDGEVIPQSGHFSTQYAKYFPPASANIGTATPNPSFTGPASFIKNTTYTFMCGPGTFQCYIGYPKSSGYYSYYNAKGTWMKSNPNAPTTASTWRRRTIMDDYKASLMGWDSTTHQIPTLMDMTVSRSVYLPIHPPTVMFTLVTPTEGGCTGVLTGTDPDCPGTTQFGGRYTASRGGSMMVTPGPNRFGGTLRFFGGPNQFFYQLITITTPYYTSVSWPNTPKSKQAAYTLTQATIGQVAISYLPGIRFRLTNPDHISRLVIGDTTPSSADCSPGYPAYGTVRPPTNAGCKYYTKQVKYMGTDWPSTTGMAQAWQPNGNTNTIQTTTGYDNRTAAGLNGVVSVVAPSLTHAYTTIRATMPDNPIQMTWSSARMQKNTFTFMPEPGGAAMLAAGFVTLAGLYRLRRR